jgi:DNA-binding response OmpR family regulator
MKALIVEDDKAVRSLLRDILSKMGLSAIEADCDDEVLKSLVYTEGIGVALIDADARDVQCRRLCEEIKSHWPYVRIIVSSEGMTELDEKVFANLGVGAFLRKPYHLPDVRNALSQALDHFNIPDYE